ncbi:helix-turn-helix domain-containing protein [uncultured Metabacillus sp.]|uniref:helix-turn-helix domain-containing protein n=1 Tax=uncultured Metabacillus sp. TaxID=2860135 RepID=UPI002606C87D|nr:helix-turn-helix domain-containing protein [uncultured Metabacillus sp.]
MKNTLGTIVRALRKEKKLTLKELGNLSGVSFSQIAKIERGEHIPSRKTTKKIADALCYEQEKLLKLAGYIPDYKKELEISPIDRYKALLKYNGTCQICGAQAPNIPIEVTHINPKTNDGSFNSNNLITLCSNCLIAREQLIKEEGIEKDLLTKNKSLR